MAFHLFVFDFFFIIVKVSLVWFCGKSQHKCVIVCLIFLFFFNCCTHNVKLLYSISHFMHWLYSQVQSIILHRFFPAIQYIPVVEEWMPVLLVLISGMLLMFWSVQKLAMLAQLLWANQMHNCIKLNFCYVILDCSVVMLEKKQWRNWKI